MKRRVLSLILAVATVITMFSCFSPTAFAWSDKGIGISNFVSDNVSKWANAKSGYVTSWSDVNANTPNYAAIQLMGAIGKMGGYEDGKFKPNNEVTRAEVATMLWRLAGSPTPRNDQYMYSHRVSIYGTIIVGTQGFYGFSSINGKKLTVNDGCLFRIVFSRLTSKEIRDALGYYYDYSNDYTIGRVEDNIKITDEGSWYNPKWRFDASVLYKTSTPFYDVNPSDWYYKAVLWCYQNGIVNGKTAYKAGQKLSTFDPNSSMTRQELAQIFWNFAQYQGKDTKSYTIKWADYNGSKFVSTENGSYKIMLTDIPQSGSFSWGDEQLRWMLGMDKYYSTIWRNSSKASTGIPFIDNMAMSNPLYRIDATKPVYRHEMAGMTALYLRNYDKLSTGNRDTLKNAIQNGAKSVKSGIKIDTSITKSNCTNYYVATINNKEVLRNGRESAIKWATVFGQYIMQKYYKSSFKYNFAVELTTGNNGEISSMAFYVFYK